MSCEVHFRSDGLHNETRMLPLTLLLLLALSFLGPATLAQDDFRARAPGKLSVETTEAGLLLNWNAPAEDSDQVTGYEISGLHVRRGTGIVLRVEGITDEETTSWTDEAASDPDLLYIYRVRALYDDAAGQWSSFVISEIELDAPEPTAVAPAPEPTTAPVIQVEPTVRSDAPPPEPTAAGPAPEATTAPPAPVLPAKPTAKSEDPPPEPTASLPEPEPTASA